jgi:hypothetical protein
MGGYSEGRLVEEAGGMRLTKDPKERETTERLRERERELCCTQEMEEEAKKTGERISSPSLVPSV